MLCVKIMEGLPPTGSESDDIYKCPASDLT